MLLIESTRLRILLMCMQFESSRITLHGVLEQSRADSITLVAWTDIQAVDIVPLERQVSNDSVFGFCYPTSQTGAMCWRNTL